MEKTEKFDDQMKKLQDIVDKLERGDSDLDGSIALYEEGLKLSKSLKKQLEELEKKVSELNKDE